MNHLCATVACLFSLLSPVGAQLLRPVQGSNQTHVVTDGDDLYTVSRDAGLGLEHVALANRIPIQLALRPGLQLELPTRHLLPANPPRDGLVLNIPEKGMYYFRGGRFLRFYPMAVGRLGYLTPRGHFKVIDKAINPTWVPPRWANIKGSIGPGPDNPLGDRWIGLSSPRLGIHGTQSPYSIGDAISHGCLRMYPEMVRELYDGVQIGMPVRIEYETVKIGKDPDSGALLVVAFADVYKLSDPLKQADQLLRKVGVGLTAPQIRPFLGRGMVAPFQYFSGPRTTLPP